MVFLACSRFSGRLVLVMLLNLLLTSVAPAAPVASPHIVVANYASGDLRRYDATTGAALGSFGSIPIRINELNTGPDGFFYVTIFSFSDQFQIVRVNPDTGATTEFVNWSGNGGIRGMDFGPDGNLYVASTTSHAILKFNGQSGQFMGNFITGVHTPIDLDFSRDGKLYVARGHHQLSTPSSILRYDAHTGAFIDTFSAVQVDTPQNILVGPDGDVYVTNQWDTAQPLVRFDGATGAVKFAVSGGLSNPQGLAFGMNNDLLVASWDDTVKRFDPSTGALLGNLVTGPSLNEPSGLVFVPEPAGAILVGIVALSLLLQRRRHYV